MKISQTQKMKMTHYLTLIQRETTLESFLLGDECSLLQNILNQLRNFNATKWQDKSKHFLYPHLLTDANEMMKFCTVKELNIIATEMRCIMGSIWFSNGAIKSENVNLIVSAFGGVWILNQEISQHKRKLFQPDSLVLIASQALRNENFPIEHLQILLATLIQRENTHANGRKMQLVICLHQFQVKMICES